MTASNRAATRESATRRLLLDATMQIMLEEGCTAATSRRVAAKAGVKPALVHYYFPTMDDLYLSVFREGAEANMQRQQRALASNQPLRALWDWASEPRGARLLLEFMALANHRDVIRSEIAAWSERFRDVQITALSFILREHDVDVDAFPPEVAAVFIACVGRMLVLESTLGINAGHRDALAFVERYLNRFEMPTRSGHKLPAR